MILNFRPDDMSTFSARFNQHLMKIQKMPNNSWKLFVDGIPTKGTFDTARKAMDRAEAAASNVVKQKTQLESK